MRLRTRNPRSSAMTIFEVLVVIVCLLFLAWVLLPTFGRAKIHSGPNCVSNLRQINIALQIFEEDNGNQYPMSVSVTDGGGKELIQAGDVAGCFQIASNEMSTVKIFVCPNDSARTFATNWNGLNGSHISYFLSADASNHLDPTIVLDGDDNVVVGGVPVASGLVNLSSNAPESWSGTRHRFCGNIGLADGSVSQTTSNGLQQAFRGTGLATNRIVIP